MADRPNDKTTGNPNERSGAERTDRTKVPAAAAPGTPVPFTPDTFILVNGKKFTEADGVKAEMNYEEIAALVNVNDRQVVRRFIDGDQPPLHDVKQDDVVKIESGMKFQVERKPEDVIPPVGAGGIPVAAPGMRPAAPVVGPRTGARVEGSRAEGSAPETSGAKVRDVGSATGPTRESASRARSEARTSRPASRPATKRKGRR